MKLFCVCVCARARIKKEKNTENKDTMSEKKNRERGKETENGSFEEAVYQSLALLFVLQGSHLHDL